MTAKSRSTGEIAAAYRARSGYILPNCAVIAAHQVLTEVRSIKCDVKYAGARFEARVKHHIRRV